jgi:hypothetical protein
MQKSILLARPHPFIVNEMKPLLTQAGFDIKGVINDAALANIEMASCSAALISLAVVSPVTMSPPQVLELLKAKKFNGKLIFAGLVPFERVEGNLKQFLAETGWNIEAPALCSAHAIDCSAGYIQQSDLAAPQAKTTRDFLVSWV